MSEPTSASHLRRILGKRFFRPVLPDNPHRLDDETLELIAQGLEGFVSIESAMLGGIEKSGGIGQYSSPAKSTPMPVCAAYFFYVVDGVGTRMDTLAYTATIVRRNDYRLIDYHADDRAWQARCRLYDRWDQLPAAVIIRLGEILAGRTPQSHTLSTRRPWLEVIARELLGKYYCRGYTDAPKIHALAHASRIETLLIHAGEDESSFVRWVFENLITDLAALPGFVASAARHAEAIRPVFDDKSTERRLRVLPLFAHGDADSLAPFVEELAEMALATHATLRAQAQPIAHRAGQRLYTHVRQTLGSLKSEQRGHALRFLWESGDEELRTFVLQRGAADAAASVREQVATLQQGAQINREQDTLRIPEQQTAPFKPLSTASRAAFRSLLDQLNQWAREASDEFLRKHPNATAYSPASAADLDALTAVVADERSAGRPPEIRLGLLNGGDKSKAALAAWAANEDVSVHHLVRLLITTQYCSINNPYGSRQMRSLLEPLAQRRRASLLQLHDALVFMEMPHETVFVNWQLGADSHIAASWGNDAIWPFFVRHREYLDGMLDGTSPWASKPNFHRQRAYDALETFPELPGDLLPALFDLAVGPSKSDRAAARHALRRVADRESRIVPALDSGKAEVRAAAAEWLAQLDAKSCVPALEAALAAEKNTVAQNAMLTALESLGAATDRFVDRDRLLKDAQKNLTKSLPTSLEWLDMSALPAIHWADTGERVPEAVVRWLIVQAVTIKSAEPSGMLRRYCSSMVQAQREHFAAELLKAWLMEDVKLIPRTEAESNARAYAKEQYQWAQKYTYPDDPERALSEQQHYEKALPGWLAKVAGSAIASKGLLALVAACGGAEIAPLAQRYIKEWFGIRAAQGKALLQMLAWVDHPSATQLMLAVGNRFRTKGLQEEAMKQAEALAERKGWTVDELADRTIPTAGFDEHGKWLIEYGARTFTAALTADLHIELIGPDGKELKNLPDARKDEDENLVKEIKKQFSTAKKELKAILDLQAARLYEALCTQRRWSMSDWSAFLNSHPIVRRYCQRLVWQVADGRTFRPLDDGSLVDATDTSMDVAPETSLVLAHASNLPPSIGEDWLRHFDDYKVTPLFAQFGRQIYRLEESRASETALNDRQGHVLDNFRLRTRAPACGYIRGPSQDGGAFFWYSKRFPTLGLTANIEFTGSNIPEENESVALKSLWFTGSGKEDSYVPAKLPLGKIPPVLLSECWNDLRTIAAEGSGFDPQWERIGLS